MAVRAFDEMNMASPTNSTREVVSQANSTKTQSVVDRGLSGVKDFFCLLGDILTTIHNLIWVDPNSTDPRDKAREKQFRQDFQLKGQAFALQHRNISIISEKFPHLANWLRTL